MIYWIPLLFFMTGLVNAQTLDDDFSFIEQPFYPNTACGDAPQNATYTLKNNENVAITITYITLSQTDSFPSDLITLDNGSLTTCNIGVQLAAQATCIINLFVNPNAGCSDDFFSAQVNRMLHVGINTWQKEVTANPIVFNYKTLGPGPGPGPGDGFAVLGYTVQNLGSVSSIIGSIGHTGGGIDMQSNYDISYGAYYQDASSPAVVEANTDFENLYNYFLDNISKTRPRSSLYDETVNSSYYLLTLSPDAYYLVDGNIIFSGSGDFVFFVESSDLIFGPNTKFEYINGASSKNLYWVLTDVADQSGYEIFLASGAQVDGTILSSVDISTDATGPNPSTINGILWSKQSITLYGDTVAIQF